MLVYRAQLAEQAVGVAAVSARLCRGSRLLGGAGAATVQVTLRYVRPSGEIRTHRGRLCAVLKAGTTLQVISYQLCAGEVLVSLEAVRRPRGGATGAFAVDQFTLPFGLVAWGITRVERVEVAGHAICSAAESGLQICGSVRLVLQTAATTLRVRIPFCRVLASSGPVGAGLRWQAIGGVNGLRLAVGAGGRMEGELTLGYRLEGQPSRPPNQHLPLRAVKELQGSVSTASAVALGAGKILAEGTAALDLYWVDRAGASRWTGRPVPFSTVLDAPEVAAGDELEVTAELERLSHRIANGVVSAHLLVGITVTVLRRTRGGTPGHTFRLQQEVAVLHGTAEADAPVLGEPATLLPVVQQRERALRPGVSGDRWQVFVTAPQGQTDGDGRWRVGVHTVVGEEMGQTREIGGWLDGVGGAFTVHPGLAAVSGEELQLRIALCRNRTAGRRSLQPVRETVEASAELPGLVRRVLRVALAKTKAGQLQVEALLQLETGGFFWLKAPVTLAAARLPGPVVCLTAMPELADGQPRLRLWIGYGQDV